jgi:hypothetical protein
MGSESEPATAPLNGQSFFVHGVDFRRFGITARFRSGARWPGCGSGNGGSILEQRPSASAAPPNSSSLCSQPCSVWQELSLAASRESIAFDLVGSAFVANLIVFRERFQCDQLEFLRSKTAKCTRSVTRKSFLAREVSSAFPG